MQIIDAVAARLKTIGLPSGYNERHYIPAAVVTPEIAPMLSVYPDPETFPELLTTDSGYQSKHNLYVCWFRDMSGVLTTARYPVADARRCLDESQAISREIETWAAGIPGLALPMDCQLVQVRRGMTQVFGGIWAAEFRLNINTWSDAAS